MDGEKPHSAKFIDDLKMALMQIEGVQAVGDSVVDGAPCLKVYFLNQATMDSARLPVSQGFPIVKVLAGSIEAQS